MTISLAEQPCPFISFLKNALQPFYPYAFVPGYQEHRYLDQRRATGIFVRLEQSQYKPHTYTMYRRVILGVF